MRSRLLQSAVGLDWISDQVSDHVRPEDTDPKVDAEDVRLPWVYHRREQDLVDELGGFPLCLPYSGKFITSVKECDVDHIVPISEAIQSGAEDWSRAVWKMFQGDLMNLMLADPKVNRWEKGAKGVGEWCPDRHRTWYVLDYSLVKLSYRLTFDRVEADVIKGILYRGFPDMPTEPPDTSDVSHSGAAS